MTDHRTDEVIDLANQVTATEPLAEALFLFLERLALDADRDQALLEALTAEGISHEATTGASSRLLDVLDQLLNDGQHAGLVRTDLDVATLKVLLTGYQTMARQLPPGSDGLSTIGDIVRSGLAP